MLQKLTLIALFMAVVYPNLCAGQQSQDNKHLAWGTSVQGVRISISMKNAVVTRQSPAEVEAVITNSSTNDIVLLLVRGPEDVFLTLTNAAGKEYILTPPLEDNELFGSKSFTHIKAGNATLTTIPVILKKEIDQGDYVLKATRDFSVGDKQFKIESNLLDVQVK
jgi:hypothetical protein